MKKILITGLLSLILCGCDLLVGPRFSGDIVEDNRKIGGFSEVRISHGFSVNMTVASQESLVIEAPEDALPHIISTVEDQRLVVKLDPQVKPSQLSAKKISLAVKSIDKIQISGTTTLTCDDLISTDTMSIGTSGKSQAKLVLNSKETQIKSSGASTVNLAGKTAFLHIQGISGESVFSGFAFTADETTAFASGKSTVKTHTTEVLKVGASGASRILYKGHPDIESHLSGEASIKNYN